ncbi:MAG: WG repeat-containing protein [Alistipes sp.]
MPRRYASVGAYPLPYLVECRYLPDELYVFDLAGQGSYRSVVLMEWADGEPLGRCLARLCGSDDREGLGALARRFDRLGLWLLEADFAHGDLKQDNLIVMPDGSLRLIDYDGVYLPSLAGRPGLVAASPAYRHPLCGNGFFGPEADDYPLALISFSLHALADDPSLFLRYSDGENILLDAERVQPGRSELYDRLMDRFAKEGALAQVRLGRLLRSPSPRLDGLAEALAGLSGIETTSGTANWSVIDDEDPRMAVVSQGGLFGYADLERGKFLLPPVYQDAGPFREGLAVVRLGGGLGLIDRDGVWRVDCGQYDYVGPLSGDRALVRRDGLYGFIDRRGCEAIAVRYPFACGFHEGRAVVRIGDKYGYIDTEGRQAIPPVFDRAYRFVGGKARVNRCGETFLSTNRMNVGSNLIKVANFIPLFAEWADSQLHFFGNACRRHVPAYMVKY